MKIFFQMQENSSLYIHLRKTKSKTKEKMSSVVQYMCAIRRNRLLLNICGNCAIIKNKQMGGERKTRHYEQEPIQLLPHTLAWIVAGSHTLWHFTYKYIQVHVQKEHGEVLRYGCTLCTAQYTDRAQIQEHVALVHVDDKELADGTVDQCINLR